MHVAERLLSLTFKEDRPDLPSNQIMDVVHELEGYNAKVVSFAAPALDG